MNISMDIACGEPAVTDEPGYISKTVSIKTDDVREFVCPVCRAITNLPKTEKYVKEWASLYPHSAISVAAKSKVKVERFCDGCQYVGESKSAQGFCVVCEASLCGDCLSVHKKTKVTREHKVISVEELDSTPENQLRFAEGFGCLDHKDKTIEYYCQSHEAFCCADCFFSDHRTCDEVKNLSKDLPSLLSDLKTQEIMDQMNIIEKHLQNFTLTNESNINKLEATFSNLTDKIQAFRKEINERLDEIERTVTAEGNRIYKEEMIRQQEENHQCQCLINAVRNSKTFLESVLKYGTDVQTFLVSKKSIAQLKSYKVLIREKYEEIESLSVQLEFGNLIKGILSQDVDSIAKLQSKRDLTSFPCSYIPDSLFSSGAGKFLREHQVKLVRVLDIHSTGVDSPWYSGGVYLTGGDIVLANRANNTCCLYDSCYNFITSYTLPEKPINMCFVDDHEVAVSFPIRKTIHFLSVRDNSFRDTGTVKTRYRCYGITAISREEVVVAGCMDDKKCYWNIVSRTAGESCYHEIDCHGESAYVALNNCKSRVYISISQNHAVYCFGLRDGRQYFVYTSNNLRHTLGIAVDREDNVFVVGFHSHNIHKLSPEGTTLQVIISGVPHHPNRIFFDKNREHFIVTNMSDDQHERLHLFVSVECSN
ncbi:hypothetical protein CHS0354_041540 [Potamilus streckersoni]|uniref:B box-type domain-containing protein n=1 Tax=Potamilus streckersoni TaxID=2493646 RepID=A0AAE0WAS0_9BIVA|nr:hypothetical protein CHS0354_041540 [Potamilus streckersoni]